MLNRNPIIENLLAGSFFLTTALSIHGAFTNNVRTGIPGTFGACASAYAWVKISEVSRKDSESNELETLRLELSTVRSQLSESQNEVNIATRNFANAETEAKRLKDLCESVQSQFQTLIQRHAGTQSSNESINVELEQLRANSTQWAAKFDEMISAHDVEVQQKERAIETLKLRNQELDRELLILKAQMGNYDEMASLKAGQSIRELHESIEKLKAEKAKVEADYIQTANTYNALLSAHKAKVSEFTNEFGELEVAVTQALPQTFNEVLNERDRELMRLSGLVNELLKPQTFDAIGEYSRADKLIDLLYNGESKLTLDASEIETIANDNSRFVAYFNLRDRKSRGKALIEELNRIGESVFPHLNCIKPITFDFDAVNPHRIKATFIHKTKVTTPKVEIDKLWIPAAMFSQRIPALLKKPVSRVSGGTGEGKTTFVNLLLAVEANRAKSADVRVHDPMDGSGEDFWHIEKTSKGLSETKKAARMFFDEFHNRTENGITTPETIDVFDEIDVVANSDSSINKEFINASKGMRHVGMRAILIGQSASVGKKGWEWSDMDNLNAVYLGQTILTAIDKCPSLEFHAENLRKTFHKLSDYCEKLNEENGLSGWNEYRVGLIVSQGKATFFELPNPDSIPCDWSKLTQESATIKAKPVEKTSTFQCPSCHSTEVKKARGSRKLASGKVRNDLICKQCNTKFQIDL